MPRREKKILTECAVNFQRIQDKLERLDEALSGDNGIIAMLKDHKGKLEEHDDYIKKRKGQNLLIAAVIGSGWFSTLVLGFFQLLK